MTFTFFGISRLAAVGERSNDTDVEHVQLIVTGYPYEEGLYVDWRHDGRSCEEMVKVNRVRVMTLGAS